MESSYWQKGAGSNLLGKLLNALLNSNFSKWSVKTLRKGGGGGGGVWRFPAKQEINITIIPSLFGWMIIGLIVPFPTSPVTAHRSPLCNYVAHQLPPDNNEICASSVSSVSRRTRYMVKVSVTCGCAPLGTGRIGNGLRCVIVIIIIVIVIIDDYSCNDAATHGKLPTRGSGCEHGTARETQFPPRTNR